MLYSPLLPETIVFRVPLTLTVAPLKKAAEIPAVILPLITRAAGVCACSCGRNRKVDIMAHSRGFIIPEILICLIFEAIIGLKNRYILLFSELN
jgi:hypothetical protein